MVLQVVLSDCGTMVGDVELVVTGGVSLLKQDGTAGVLS